MGLDMYAMTTANAPAAPVDFKQKDANELHYWRKHPNLHGWMERLYRIKGGAQENFNCVNVQITAQDLDYLEAAICEKSLPPTEGFFFGASDGTEVDDDLEFVRKARAEISNGNFVFYTSWW